jgi:hypothetical protein
MSAWKQMVSAALVGTSQAKAPELPAPLAEAIPAAFDPKAGIEAAFLAAAGALSLWRRAGAKPVALDQSVTPAGAEERPCISRHSANHLRRMLRGDFAAFFPVWLEAAGQAGLRVPFDQLPALLEAARQYRELRRLADAVAGRRGAWLAAQNPDWDFAVAETEDLWETGNRDQRLKFLVALRARDAATALARIQTTWKSDPADARTAFVNALESGLSMADEPFLESALDDRSKEVRRAASSLLAQLPESRLVARMVARATPLLTLKPAKLLAKAALEVTLPPDADAAATRDNLDPKSFSTEKKFGEKASLLLQILAAMPPAHWSRAFNLTPDKLLAAAKKDEFSRALISGWAWAAFRFRDAEWAQALITGPLPMEDWIGVGPKFLNGLPPEARGAWLAERVRANGLVEKRHAVWNDVLPILLEFDAPWPPPLIAAVDGALSQIAANGFFWHLRAEAQRLLLRLPPDFAARLTAAWPADKEGVSDLVDFASFRLEALNALKKS